MKITDKRINSENAPLTFDDLQVGDWYEYATPVISFGRPNGPRLKTNPKQCVALHHDSAGKLDGFPNAYDQVRLLDVEIIIHGNL